MGRHRPLVLLWPWDKEWDLLSHQEHNVIGWFPFLLRVLESSLLISHTSRKRRPTIYVTAPSASFLVFFVRPIPYNKNRKKLFTCIAFVIYIQLTDVWPLLEKKKKWPVVTWQTYRRKRLTLGFLKTRWVQSRLQLTVQKNQGGDQNEQLVTAMDHPRQKHLAGGSKHRVFYREFLGCIHSKPV